MPKAHYRPSGFFVLRTPLLPFKYAEPLAAGDEATIRELLADPVVREAIYLASPPARDSGGPTCAHAKANTSARVASQFSMVENPS